MALSALTSLLDSDPLYVAVDTETNGEDCRDGRGYGQGLSLAWHDEALYLPFRHLSGNYELAQFIQPLQAILDSRRIVFHNAKFDLTVLETFGLDVSNVQFLDTMILAHLVNENEPRSKSLDACVHKYVSEDLGKDKERIEYISKKLGWGMIPAGMMARYAAMDAQLTLKLYLALKPLLKKEQLQYVWAHKQRLTRVIRGMELRGVELDEELCYTQIWHGEKAMGDVVRRLNGRVPSRPKDLRVLLLEELGLEPQYHAKTGNLTFDKTAMEEYERLLEDIDKPIAKDILTYRGWLKAISSNYRSYLDLLSPDGRLRCNFKMHGTKTGRLSCEKPNLQQIPRTSNKPWNGHLKAAFVPRSGFRLVTFDYSQLELRIGAYVAQETALLNAFLEGRDIFQELAETLGIIRYSAKTLMYANNYGAGTDRIASLLKVRRTESEQLLRGFHSSYPRLRAASVGASREAMRKSKIQTLSGRYRHFQYQSETHKAWNSFVQGSAADIVEETMVRIDDEGLNNDDCRLLLQIHDELVFEIREDLVDKYTPEIEDCMMRVPQIPGLMLVNGQEWGSK